MSVFIALLRGINVSGQKTIKMDRLASIFESMSFRSVQTYIQSGNVVFRAAAADTGGLQRQIESKLQQELGFDVPVIVRTQSEMEEIIRRNPFLSDESGEVDPVQLHATILAEEPSAAAVDKLMTYRYEPDEIKVMGREVYLLCRNGYGKTKYTNAFLEKKLGASATTRNWATVNKLTGLARDSGE